MKKPALIFILFFISCMVKAQQGSIILKNPGSFYRSNEAVIISREQLENLTGKKIVQNKYPLFTSVNKEVVLSQADDFNNDGEWDEIILLYSFQPDEEVVLNINFVSSYEIPAIAPLAHARLAKLYNYNEFVAIGNEVMPLGHKPTDFSVTDLPLYQAEGPLWENDKIAFRLYFDNRNGKDIFGKTTGKMVMDSVGLPGNNYHLKDWWGMDILKVGSSLGAGALAISVKNIKGKEMLVRLGQDADKVSYELVADGPLRAIFRLHYNGMQILPGKKMDVTEEISIIAGQYAYQSKITVPQEAVLVTGIVNLYSRKVIQKKTGKFTILATHDRQSENQDYLGMAILVNNNSFSGFGETQKKESEQIQNTYYAKMKIKTSAAASFRFYGCWEATDKRFKDEAFFLNFLQAEAEKLSSPIQIKIRK